MDVHIPNVCFPVVRGRLLDLLGRAWEDSLPNTRGSSCNNAAGNGLTAAGLKRMSPILLLSHQGTQLVMLLHLPERHDSTLTCRSWTVRTKKTANRRLKLRPKTNLNLERTSHFRARFPLRFGHRFKTFWTLQWQHPQPINSQALVWKILAWAFQAALNRPENDLSMICNCSCWITMGQNLKAYLHEN